MSYIQVDTKKFLVLVVVVVLVFLVIFGVKSLADNHPSFYANCSEARAHHDTNIPKSSAYYRPELDRDHDGFACE